jgi:sterol desaturase/sphingolipid hydroxylase (fatty acid hydroxylase superfamily)
MERDYIALAGPAFFVLIAIELWVGHRRRQDYYRLNDAVNDISTGILMQLTTLFFKGVILAGFFAIHAHFRLFDLSADRAWTWIACFLGVDLAYYWFHRLSHEINFLWAAHVVHHQSEEYNLAVALRQSSLQPFFSAVFYWPLALIGFPPLVFLACSSFNTLYQFWLHTRAIDRLGPLEAVLVTPSHHRVHHGRNPLYIDRNHGGTFIVWDRMFGTFQKEEEEVVYGITKPLASWNPVWANLHYWVELFQTAHRTRRPVDKLRTFIKPPGWFPADQGGFQPAPPIEAHPVKFDRVYPPALRAYAIFQFATLTLVMIALGLFARTLDAGTTLAGASLITWGLVNLGGLFEGRAWSFYSEMARVLVAPALALLVLSGSISWLATAAFALGIPFFALRMAGELPFYRIGGGRRAMEADGL